MPVRAVCMSHSPIMASSPAKPAFQSEIDAAFSAQREAAEEFDPELVVILGADHYTGFTYQVMPPFCVGAEAVAVDDEGGFPGRLRTDPDTASNLVGRLSARDVDAAISHSMTVDHGFSQVLTRLLGGLDRTPTLPIMVNTTARPQPRPRRARLLGTALGEILAADPRRVLVVGSGGLSHDPSPIFPQLADAEPPVRAYVAGHAGELDRPGWLQMVREKTTWAARMLADGNLEREIGINPAWDRAFVDRLSSEPVEWVDSLEIEDLTRDGGSGAVELLIWIAVVAAAQAADCAPAIVDLCVSTPQYGIGLGVLHADPAVAA
ncbi:3-carboxyethylcatechol 2,3-dioxygenase [Streptomyces hokutonensis]|uniref:3-carboxyethylcatechol 2,3-dioxygenase n=1 Tax=Streptomyces hokutonensis TaxID=1306990 RepID=A0ABW6M5F6_9ACTN